MKRAFKTYWILLLLLLAHPGKLWPQEAENVTAGSVLEVFTDRNLYVAGEPVLISAVLKGKESEQTVIDEKVLYCELIAPDGSRITGAKFPLEKRIGQGCLRIPEETITGNYYLKSYTRAMRNGPLSNYHFLLITVINPIRTEVLAGKNDNHQDDATLSNPEPGIPTGSGRRFAPPETRTGGLSLSTDHESYSSGDTVTVVINPGKEENFPSMACLSVVPEPTYRKGFTPVEITDTAGNDFSYLPETRGISLSGRLHEGPAGKPVPGALVNLSIIGDRDCMALRTDSSGRFFFALPGYTGSRDIFLSAEEIPGISPTFLVDNDFCSRPLDLPSTKFNLDETEKKTAFELVVNMKIASVYGPDSMSAQTSLPGNGKPFYGDPTETLVLDNYIELPTLEEYFNELPYGVRVRKEQGEKEFRFYTTQVDMTIYDPLVMIDWVAVNDVSRVLSMSPREIDRIELVNAPYVKGSITYGGIISFVSKNNDFGGIDLPSSGTFINYKFFEECDKRQPEENKNANIPDSRNTIFWEPDLHLEMDGPTRITFIAPATPGHYLVLLRGINERGEEILVKGSVDVQ
jgi:hypothetical protein